MALNEKQQKFADEYLIDRNATQAAIRAGYSKSTAYSQGQRLLKHAEVAAFIDKRREDLAERTEITQDRVLQELWAIATADPNDLIQFRRKACPACWGEPEPDVEEELEPQAHGGALLRARANDTSGPDVAPNPECGECYGDGVGYAFVADTRRLTGAARKLYAGVKITRQGLEVKMHDKAAALVAVGKHLGMFVDKHEHTGNVIVTMQDLDEKL